MLTLQSIYCELLTLTKFKSQGSTIILPAPSQYTAILAVPQPSQCSSPTMVKNAMDDPCLEVTGECGAARCSSTQSSPCKDGEHYS